MLSINAFAEFSFKKRPFLSSVYFLLFNLFLPCSISNADLTVKRIPPEGGKQILLNYSQAISAKKDPPSLVAPNDALPRSDDTIVFDLSASFPPADIGASQFMIRGKMSTRNVIHLEGAAIADEPAGAPAIPYIEYYILLPKGYSFLDGSLDFYQSRRMDLPEGLNFIPGKISFTDLQDPELKNKWEASLREDETIYGAPGYYPPLNYEFDEQIHMGYRILSLKIKPFKYHPLTRELLSFPLAKGHIRLQADPPEKRIPEIYLRTKEKDLTLIKRMVVNDEELSTYIVDARHKGVAP